MDSLTFVDCCVAHSGIAANAEICKGAFSAVGGNHVSSVARLTSVLGALVDCMSTVVAAFDRRDHSRLATKRWRKCGCQLHVVLFIGI